MNIDSLYPSTYLKAADIPQGREFKLQITGIDLADVGDNTMKPVLHFKGADKGLVLNKTNGFIISMDYGPETDAWIGRAVILRRQLVNFQGRMVPGIGVSTPQAPLAPGVQHSQDQPAFQGSPPVQQSAGHNTQPAQAGQIPPQGPETQTGPAAALSGLAQEIGALESEQRGPLAGVDDNLVDIPF